MLLNLFIGFTNPAFFSARTENKKGNSIVLKEEI